MRFRYLRIAFSATCAIACVLLVAMWVRSRYAYDGIYGPLPGSGFVIMSRSGGLGVGLHCEKWAGGWSLFARPPWKVNLPYRTALGFVEYMKDSEMYRLRLPYWCLILISVAFAAVPWLRWRFSLRTLLIAITAIAVVLELVVWMSRAG